MKNTIFFNVFFIKFNFFLLKMCFKFQKQYKMYLKIRLKLSILFLILVLSFLFIMSEVEKNIDESCENYICQFTRQRDYLDEIDNDSKENKSRSNNKKKQKNNNEETLQLSLEFTPFQHTHHLHNSNVVLSDSFQSENPTPYTIFSEFFSQD